MESIRQWAAAAEPRPPAADANESDGRSATHADHSLGLHIELDSAEARTHGHVEDVDIIVVQLS